MNDRFDEDKPQAVLVEEENQDKHKRLLSLLVDLM